MFSRGNPFVVIERYTIGCSLSIISKIPSYSKGSPPPSEIALMPFLTQSTANDTNSIPEALKDRLEIIDINGYTEIEKLEIAKKYLIPTICEKHGINNIKITDENILDIIRYYTKETLKYFAYSTV